MLLENLANNKFIYPYNYTPIHISKPIDTLVQDTLDTNITMLDFIRLNRKFKIIIFYYNRLKGSLERWLEAAKHRYPSITIAPTKDRKPVNVLLLTQQKKGCRFFYDLLTSNNENDIIWPKCHDYWERKLEASITIDNWNKNVLQNQNSHLYNNLREMQMNIFRNNAYTNSRIAKFDTTVSENCNICKIKETISHKIYDCPLVRKLWTILETSFSTCNIVTKFDKETAILGCSTENGNSCKNILIKATKKFVFKCSYVE